MSPSEILPQPHPRLRPHGVGDVAESEMLHEVEAVGEVVVSNVDPTMCIIVWVPQGAGGDDFEDLPDRQSFVMSISPSFDSPAATFWPWRIEIVALELHRISPRSVTITGCA